MRLYFVKFRDEDWGVAVAAHTGRQVRKLAYPYLCDFEDGDYIDVRVNLRRHIAVPAAITMPTVYTSCQQAWMCDAWGYDADFCRGCALDDEKRREEEGDDA